MPNKISISKDRSFLILLMVYPRIKNNMDNIIDNPPSIANVIGKVRDTFGSSCSISWVGAAGETTSVAFRLRPSPLSNKAPATNIKSRPKVSVTRNKFLLFESFQGFR